MIWSTSEDHEWWRPAALRKTESSRDWSKIFRGLSRQHSPERNSRGANDQSETETSTQALPQQEASEHVNLSQSTRAADANKQEQSPLRNFSRIDEQPEEFNLAQVAYRCAMIEAKYRACLTTAVIFTEYASQVRPEKLDIRALQEHAAWLATRNSTNMIGGLADRQIKKLARYQEEKFDKSSEITRIDNAFQEVNMMRNTYERLCNILGRSKVLYHIFPWEISHQEAGKQFEAGILGHILDRGTSERRILVEESRGGQTRKWKNSVLNMKRSFSRLRGDKSAKSSFEKNLSM